MDFSILQIPRKVLTSHLAELVEDNLITRKFYAETPPRVEYSLIEKAKELVLIFEAMEKWCSYLIDLNCTQRLGYG